MFIVYINAMTDRAHINLSLNKIFQKASEYEAML